MINIAVSIGEVSTEVMTDQQLSFDAIETLLTRATASTLEAYNKYFVSIEQYENSLENDDE
jgi:hypothetical protein